MRAGVKIYEQNGVRKQECRVECAPFGIGGLCAGAAGKHHKDPIVLTAVMPGAPGYVQRKKKRQSAKPEVRDHRGDQQQPIFVPVWSGCFFANCGPVTVCLS